MTHGYTFSTTAAQEHGGDSFEEYEARDDCAQGAVE